MIKSHAVVVYPETFPLFRRDGYGFELDMGLIQAPNDILTNTQRRSYTNLPTIIGASLVLPVAKLYEFTNWVNKNVGLWVELPLAHPFMERNNQIEMVPARILNFVLGTAYQDFGTVGAAFTLQLSPTVFIETLQPGDPYEWVIAGTAPFPSTDWMIGGKPNKLPAEWINAGRPSHPGAPA